MDQPTSRPATLSALEAIARAHRYERKLLVCRRPAEGRELLRALAAGGEAWLGFEVTTLWQLAQTVVGEKLAAQNYRLIDGFDQAALLDEAIERVLGAETRGRLKDLADGTGLRQAVANAVQALRLAGIDAAMLGRTRLRDEDKRAQLARMLTCYEDLLETPPAGMLVTPYRKLTDTAGTFRLAAASLRVGDAAPPEGVVLLLPGHSRRGLSGQLIDALVERGAIVLPADAVKGFERPAALLAADDGPDMPATRLGYVHAVAEAPADAAGVLEIFAATSVTAELREVLRRVLAAGLAWDQVEILATDPLTYGVALDGLARRLDIPVTHAGGLPVSRTRPGRAVTKYLEWIVEGFPADVLRGMLERGDLAVADADVNGTRLARELRRLKVGRGRDRYAAAIERAKRSVEREPTPDDERTPQELAEERARRSAALHALSTLLDPILAATPPLPDRVALHEARVEPAALARGVLAMLRFVPVHSAVEHTARTRLTERLERIERTATRAVALPAAITLLTTKLDARVPAPDAAGPSPWGAAGGHLHFSDIDQGGYTQRAAVFVVGLDAGRFPGSGHHDALLVDDDRRRLTLEQAIPALPTAADRVEEKRWAFAALLSRLRGRVTLSYSTWDAVEGRATPPASELLQAYRLMSGDVSADYEQMHRALAPAASPVPKRDARLDAADVWLGALAHAGTLRYGVPAVRCVYAGIDAGIRAGVSLLGDRLTPHHGVITPRPRLDPRTNATLVMSPTQLEKLGTCPHRYLLRYVLRIKKPEDPEYSPEQWLTALDRGALMHRVYEKSLTDVERRDLDVGDPEFESVTMRVLEQELAAARATLPPPGEAVYELEADRLREDTRAFVAMVREDGRRWVMPLERKFGDPGVTDPIEVPLTRGSLRLRGAIDRIDRLEDGRLVVIDYKTGSSLRYGEKFGPYDGGRRLQHVLYAAVAQRLEHAEVARVEYQFPTRRAENHRAKYGTSVLNQGLVVVEKLLTLVENGMFHPTNDREDCKFCDFAAACRVRVNDYGEVTAPLAEWVRSSPLEELDLLRELRR